MKPVPPRIRIRSGALALDGARAGVWSSAWTRDGDPECQRPADGGGRGEKVPTRHGHVRGLRGAKIVRRATANGRWVVVLRSGPADAGDYVGARQPAIRGRGQLATRCASRYRWAVPELPDITVYREALAARVVGRPLLGVHVTTPFVLRSVEPPLAAFSGALVTGVERLGKRIVIACEEERFLVIHLMIAGRLKWIAAGEKAPARGGLATFAFESGRWS